MSRRIFAAILISTVATAGAATSAGARFRAADGGQVWPDLRQAAPTYATRVDLQTVQAVRARGSLPSACPPGLLPNDRSAPPLPDWVRTAWAGPCVAAPRNLLLSDNRPRGPPGPGSSCIES